MKRTLFILVVFCISTSAMATTILVPSEQSSIQAGIDAAVEGDSVIVSDGTYYERITFDGKGIVVASQYVLDGDTNHITNTIIDGDTSVVPIVTDTGSVVRFVNDEDSTAELNGFTARNGIGIADNGGVAYCWNSSPTVKNCHLTDGAYGNGDGIFYDSDIYSHVIRLDSCRITSNQGAGIAANSYYRAYINDSYIDGNSGIGIDKDGGSYFLGGTSISNNNGHGIYSRMGYVSVTDCAIDSNLGTGIEVDYGATIDITAISSSVSGNSGGGIKCSGWLTVNNCQVNDNGGTGLSGPYDWAEVSVVGCTIKNNSSTGIGIGIFQNPTIDSCTIEGHGTAIGVGTLTSPKVSNCLFIDNDQLFSSSSYQSGQVRNCTFWNCGPIHAPTPDGSKAGLGIYNTIFAYGSSIPVANVASGAYINVECSDFVGNVGGNWTDIESFEGINGNFSLDPLFCDPLNNDFSIASNSPCAPGNNDCDSLIGAYPIGCGPIFDLYHVSPTGSDETGTGEESNPFATIQHTIDVCFDADTVVVHDGQYFERITPDGKNLTLLSEYALDGDTNHIYNTIIDADTSVLGVADTGSVVRFVNDEDSVSSLIGFTIQNGTGTFGKGAAIYLWTEFFPSEFELRVQNCRLISNTSADDYGCHTHRRRMSFSDCYLDSDTGDVLVMYKTFVSINDSEVVGDRIRADNIWTTLDVDHSILNCDLYFPEDGEIYIDNSVCQNAHLSSFGTPDYACIIGRDSHFRGTVSCSKLLDLRRCEVDSMVSTFITDAYGILDSCIVRGGISVGSRTAFRLYRSEMHGTCVNRGFCWLMESTILGSVNPLITQNAHLGIHRSTVVPDTTVAVYGESHSTLITCTDFYGLAEGDAFDLSIPPGGTFDTANVLYVDPLFCNEEEGNYRLCNTSPCAPENNDCDSLIGAYDVGCACEGWGDTLRIGNSEHVSSLYPATMYFPVYLNNHIEIDAGHIPLNHNWDFDPDSVSFDGTRLDYAELAGATIDDDSNEIRVWFFTDIVSGNPPLQPVDPTSRDSCIAKIFYTVACEPSSTCDSTWILPPDTTTIELAEDTIRLALVDDLGQKTVPYLDLNNTLLMHYRPGDANGNCERDIDDIVYLINYVFGGGDEPVCVQSGDVNGSCMTDIDDIVYFINYVFAGGPSLLPYCYME